MTVGPAEPRRRHVRSVRPVTQFVGVTLLNNGQSVGSAPECWHNDEVAVVVITVGDEWFSAGLDLQLQSSFTDDTRFLYGELCLRAYAQLLGYPKPTIAAVAGPTLGWWTQHRCLLRHPHRFPPRGLRLTAGEVRPHTVLFTAMEDCWPESSEVADVVRTTHRP